MKKIIGIIVTIAVTGTIFFVYLLLENFFYSDFGCGCSSTCTGYYPTIISRIAGYTLVIIAILIFIASIWQIKRFLKWWTIVINEGARYVFDNKKDTDNLLDYNKDALALTTWRWQWKLLNI